MDHDDVIFRLKSVDTATEPEQKLRDLLMYLG